ncbi:MULTISPECIES: hypothetical protein [unclassified Rhizobium]|uniref:hypothetical protein n=1 Tax=unclassified Rhizobium TaxID=2613769 RepID=UPI0028891599|nr:MULTISPECIES: hypothetical protein [unclassified Rhizobium]
MKQDIQTRIANAFDADLSAKELTDLIADVALADGAAKNASEAASETALNPATRPEAVSQARKEMEDANFQRLRMERAAAKLAEMRDAAVKREKSAAEKVIRDAAIAERDQMVLDLAEYEELSRKIEKLLVRLAASNAKVGQFETAETIARGAEENWMVRVDSTLPKLLEDTRLPKFRRDGSNQGFLWPKR